MHPNELTPPQSHPRHRWFVLGLLLFFVALSGQYVIKILDKERDNRSAILRWRDQILLVDHDVNIYDTHNYPNPPIMVLLLKPVVELPPLAGALTWYYLKLAMAFASILLVFRLIETPGRRFPDWAKALAVLLGLRPIMGDLSHGNINIFILFLVVLSLYAFHRKRDLASGLLLALAITAKVTPALFVPYFVWKRAWAALAGCVAGLVLFFWLVPGLALGFDRNADFLDSWFERMILPYVVGGEITPEHNNQSLPGLLQRMLTHSPSFSDYVGDVYVPLEYHNLTSVHPSVVRWSVKGAMLLFALAFVLCCRTPTEPRSGWRLAAEYALIVLGMLLFSERTWKHHCVTLILPFGVIAYYLATCNPSRGMRNYLIATLALVMLLMATTTSGVLPELTRGAKLAQTYGAYVWAYLLLLVALFAMLRSKEEGAALSPQPAGSVSDERNLHPVAYASGS
jgi:alpha-1,2-mannosyltransferase